MNTTRSDIRNVAIIAHVDHGKTTLVDKLFRHVGTTQNETDRVMDSGDLERERGITILAKNTGILYGDHRINIVDTPGHADFGGEVERTLQMVEGFILLVDAAEGVLPGTRFVLHKALALKLRPIVVINKIDRQDADIAKTESSIHDLFLDLATDADQLDFPMLYGSSKLGFMNTDPAKREGSMQPLLDAIVEHVPAPVEENRRGLQFLVTNLGYSDFLGRLAIGRVFSGSMRVGQQVICCKDEKVSSPTKITKMFAFEMLQKVEIQEAQFGDIVSIAGLPDDVTIGTTVCAVDNPLPHSYVAIDEPTLAMYFSVNDSPFNGRDGKLLTSRQIKERLEKELLANVALRVEQTDLPEVFKVSGRGQLHLGILIETMRREGFELQVSCSEVIYKKIDGVKNEPFEQLVVDVEEAYQGAVLEMLGKKKAQVQDIGAAGPGRMRLVFKVPARGLIGFRGQFLTETRGTGIAAMSFLGYEPYCGEIPTRINGSLVSMENGTTTAYALDALQARGVLFVAPGEPIYEGMIIGENSRSGDLTVNPCKQKKLTNMRASGSDDSAQLAPPRIMELERCMDWIRPDELIEVTPHHVRLRKKVLRAALRK